MVNIEDYSIYPDSKERDAIYNKKKDSWDKIHLEHENKKYNILMISDIDQMEIDTWIMEFNNRAFDLVNNYTMLSSYYNQGIPDDPWYASPGPKGESVRYYPLFTKEKHHALQYWFGFYAESYYTRFTAMLDAIYNLINAKYKLRVPQNSKFRGEVLNKLKSSDRDLYNYLKKLPKDQIFKDISEFRNDIAHNFRPNQVSSGITREYGEDGVSKISFGIGKYTTTKEFMDNIDESVDFLAKITDDVRSKFQ